MNHKIQTHPTPAELYHNSSLSLWLSVDPLSDKYPGVTPYAYCVNNSIRIIDPDGRDWYENENGKILWDDNVTKKSKLPSGCTYIGANNQDIVKHYGFKQHQTRTTTKYGMICMGEEGYHWTKVTTKTDINIEANINYSGSEKTFEGIAISARTVTTSPGSTEGPLELHKGNLEVQYCGMTFSSPLKEDRGPHFMAYGSKCQEASIIISPEQLRKSCSFIKPIQSVSVKGNYGVNGFDQQYRPLVLHALLPFPRQLNENF